jgi:uncharacterized protein
MQQVSAILGSVITIYITLAAYSVFQQNQQKKKINDLNFQILKTRLATEILINSHEEQVSQCWNGTRKFSVFRKIEVAEGIYSFHLIPHDRKPLPLFKPGQFLTFKIDIPGENKTLYRCYSISSAPNSEYYQVTIKRVPGGIVSNHFCDHVHEKTILDIQAPRGQFCIELESQKPLVLLAGGVGVTPLLSMIEAVAGEKQKRDIYLFYSSQKQKDFIRKEYLQSLPFQHDNISIFFGTTQHSIQDESTQVDFSGRLSVEYLKTILPSNNFVFYICGPGQMMENLKNDLLDWKVPGSSIHTEEFGPQSIISNEKKTVYRNLSPSESEVLQVSFSKSDKKQSWNYSQNDLLSFIEDIEIPIETGCRTGNCGVCETAIQSGSIKQIKPMSYPCQAGNCLPCISIPETNLELDL